MILNRAGIILAVLLLSGCFPRYATLRPAFETQVVNPRHQPLPQAQMQVITGRFPPSPLLPQERFLADAQGRLVADKKAQWETAIFFLHGISRYSWRWCIEAPGYFPQLRDGDSLPDTIVLQPTSRPTDCSQL